MPYAEGDGMTGSGARLHFLATTALLAAALPAAAQQLDSAFLGSWASEAKECDETSDARFEITQTGMSGPEFLCTTIAAVPQGDGWAMRLACAAEGVEYTADSHWQLLPNGNLRQSANGVVTEYLPCRKGAAAAASGDGETTGSGLAANPKGAETIRYVQRRLSEMGFDPGSVDGRFGTRTARALRAFEVSRGLPETGEANRANLAALAGTGGGEVHFDPEAIHAAIRTIIESYQPSTAAYDYREEAARAVLARLLKAPPFGGIDVAGFETEAVPSGDSKDPYDFISNPATFTPARRFFVSPQHKALADEFKAARMAQPGLSAEQAEEFDTRFKALLAQTRDRLGTTHPAVGFVLEDYIQLRSDMIARFEGGLGLINAELSTRHGDAARVMLGGWSSSSSGRLVADHIAANIVSSVAKSLDWREGCAAHRSTAYAAYLKAAAIDHAASGASLRQIGWLLGAARCTENAEQAGTIMRARVELARMTGSGEAQAQALAELGAAQFSAGDRAGAASAYREAFRLAVLHGLAPSYETGFVADWEGFAEKRTAPAHWQVLNELGLGAELDLYIAHVLRRQIADGGFESTYGASLVSSFVDVLEGSGRTALADQYYTYIGHTRRRDDMKGPVSPLSIMTMFTAQRIDSERYDAVLPMLDRGLKRAEAMGDKHFTVVLLAQLARAHTERGALDEGLNHARRALVMIKQGGVDVTADDVKRAVADLETIVTSAEREQSRLDNAVGGLAVAIQGKLDAACEGTVTPWAFPALPANLMLSNPVIAQALLQHPVVARYIDCFDRGREAFSGPGVEPGDRSAGDRISDVVVLLALLGEKERVAALYEFFHAKGEKSLGAEAAVLRGLVIAGKGDWFLPYARRSADLAMTTLSAAKQDDVFPQPSAHIGLDLLAIGERGL